MNRTMDQQHAEWTPEDALAQPFVRIPDGDAAFDGDSAAHSRGSDDQWRIDSAFEELTAYQGEGHA